MKKKVHPKDQTEELRRTKFQFLVRNEKESEKLKELVERNDKIRDELTTKLATVTGQFSQEQKDRWDFFYSGTILDGELAEYLKKEKPSKAVNAVWRWLDYNMETAYQDMATKRVEPVILDKARHEYLVAKVFDFYCRDAREIFTELTDGRPAVHLLAGIDLTRNKGVILAEVEALITEYQRKLGIHEMPEKRFKWLSTVDELLEVWDLYDQAGQQPWRKTFQQISKTVNRPVSTVKEQWYAAYERIYRQPYEPGIKYATEDKRGEADGLCAECPHGACYKKSGDWIPCKDYLKIAGKDREIKTTEYDENVLYNKDWERTFDE